MSKLIACLRPAFLMFFLSILVLSFIGCVTESDYATETGTLTIPWGPKDGNRPQDDDTDLSYLNS